MVIDRDFLEREVVFDSVSVALLLGVDVCDCDVDDVSDSDFDSVSVLERVGCSDIVSLGVMESETVSDCVSESESLWEGDGEVVSFRPS
jgi:hypothetical protein